MLNLHFPIGIELPKEAISKLPAVGFGNLAGRNGSTSQLLFQPDKIRRHAAEAVLDLPDPLVPRVGGKHPAMTPHASAFGAEGQTSHHETKGDVRLIALPFWPLKEPLP